jgi:Metallo-beta-lactamase superfamily
MANAPLSVRVRMYNVGFGDCFLVTFDYGDGKRHMLIDFGTTAAPKRGPRDYMLRIARDIEKESQGKLDILVATHRHRDHISGFAGDTETGPIIASLKPDHIIQPWTEDPAAESDALTATATIYTNGNPDPQKMKAHFLGSLADMHRVAGAVLRASENEALAGKETREQLRFLGDDNLKNESAVTNLMNMGTASHYVNAGMRLDLLPGVKITVLGPPTLEQSDEIRKQRAKDPDEFWQFRRFWGAQSFALAGSSLAAETAVQEPRLKSPAPPPNVRWFVRQSRQIHAEQLLELVRDLDSVMNNTSVILLVEIGCKKLLFPGDAQIENWAYALSKPEWTTLLADVNLYKVGHHGSLNATPKSLWNRFRHKGGGEEHDRIDTLCSTKPGKHGSVKSGTEVPRHLLVEELEKNSNFKTTENFSTLYEDTIIDV